MSLFRNLWNSKNYRISLLLALVMLLWLASGVLVGETEAESDQETDQAREAEASVKAKVINASELPLVVSIRARTEPNRTVELQAKVEGTVQALPVNKGDFVEAGEVVCELEVEDRKEILNQAQAGLEKAEIDYDGAQRLESGGFQSQSEIAQALASLEVARAAYRRAQLDLEYLEIKAPFDGFIDERPVELGDFMQRGEMCARILDLDPLLVTGQVSEKDIAQIASGDPVNATLITGEAVSGAIRFVERSADEVTRTFRLEAEIPNSEYSLLSGVSAALEVPTGTAMAQLINSSLLILTDSGELGVKVLDNDNRVRLMLVELISDSSSGVWVSGLPQSTTIITLGQQYVSDGEAPVVTLEDSSASTSARTGSP